MILVIDGFLKDPDYARNFALQQEFLTAEQASKKHNVEVRFPGVRTESVLDLHYEYGKDVILTLLERVKDYIGNKEINTSSYFQVCFEKDKAWIHKDDSALFAAVLYLTPNAPYNSGTSLYDEDKQVTDVIANKYNRLVIYSADVFHKADKYFGDNLENGRLTQVFFIYDHLNKFIKNAVK